MTVGTLDSPCRKKGYKPVYAKRHIPGRNDVFVVPALAFKNIINDLIARLNREADNAYEDDEGGIELLADRADAANPGNAARYKRRIYDARHDNCRSVGGALAEQILSANDVPTSSFFDLPTVPAGLEAAMERIEARLWLKEVELPDEVIEELALDLLEFAYILVHDVPEAIRGAEVIELPFALTTLAREAA